MTGITRWWWVRHAPVIGVDGVIYGCEDIPCDTSDGERFTSLAAILPADAVWLTSNLSRTRDTAAAIFAAGMAGAGPRIEPDLAEQNFGRWQGRRWADVKSIGDPVYDAFWRAPAVTAPPGGESFADLIARVDAAIARLTREHAGSDIVAVAHGGTVRAAVAVALGLPPINALAVKVDTLSLTRLDHIPDGPEAGRLGGGWRVVGVNMPVVLPFER